ncbi:MAG: hypothetical protein PHE15_00275 [Dehalococcoidales bacterium]|nr:hypothetical protein [Dehalococcoidales bacterium]
MNEKTKAGIEAAIELFKGWIRPIVVLGMTAVICVMTVEGRLSEIDWQFWVVYAGFASVWLGEGTINKLMQVKK